MFIWKIPDKSIDKERREKEEEEENEDIVNRTILTSDVHLRLRSHRSIVNQCTFNRKHFLLATSGIEKVVKIWSPYELPATSGGGLMGADSEFAPKRRLFTYADLLTYRRQANEALRQQQNQPAQHPPQSPPPDIEEDRMMIAFFDFQIQRKYYRDSESIFSEEILNDDEELSLASSVDLSDDDDDDSDDSDDSDDDSEDSDDDDDDDDDDDEDDEESSHSNELDENSMPFRTNRSNADHNETSTNTSFSDDEIKK